ncbi:MAG: DNA translocase FtsK, partial [Deltaproteobacteria bacterium]|nr:DNA translocase FtsK [Deltaproteobacteria bacterium]
MATSKSKAAAPGRSREVLGIGLLGIALFSLVSLASMQAGNNRIMGPGGAKAAVEIYSLAGIASYLLICACLVVSVRLCRRKPVVAGLLEPPGFVALVSSVAVLCHLPFADGQVLLRGPGGLLGQYVGQLTASFIGPVGAALAATTLLCTAIILLTDIRVAEVVVSLAWAGRHVGRGLWWLARMSCRGAAATVRALGRVVVAMFPDKSEAEAAAEESAEVLESERAEREATEDEMLVEDPALAAGELVLSDEPDGTLDGADAAAMRELEGDSTAYDLLAVGDSAPATGLAETESAAQELPADVGTPVESEERRAVAAVVAEVAAVECAAMAEAEKAGAPEPKPEEAPIAIIAPVMSALDDGPTEASETCTEPPAEAGPTIVPAVAPPVEKLSAPEEDGPGYIKLSDGAFQLPSSDLLEYQPPKGGETDAATLRALAERLEQALSNYGVQGRVTAIQMGPVIITFEFAPAPGTRTGKIVQLENDLAMALEAQSVRIVAPIPGKAVVGIEIPNKKRETVYLKEILEDDGFKKAGNKLQICLGKDTKGAPVSVNLAKMPHLLVAGTTGSGKSVAVNGM